MFYGSRPKKRPEVTTICKLTMTRQNKSEWDQRARLSDPQIILGIRVMRDKLESNAVMA